VRVTLAEYDPRWPSPFEHQANCISTSLEGTALLIEHIGSTSVVGLSAKPIIDILLVVADSADEPTYVSLLQRAGYELRIREPEWHQHRMFKTPAGDLDLAVEQTDVAALCRWLHEHGYKDSPQPDRTPWNFVLEDEQGRKVDVHVFVRDAAGRIVDGIKYPATALTGSGTIDGHPVRCIAPDYVVRFRQAYTPRAVDVADVLAICERFGLEVPSEFKR
jgi:GrpB-like predicted nucleotidyltransferase (UPF0157 family)